MNKPNEWSDFAMLLTVEMLAWAATGSLYTAFLIVGGGWLVGIIVRAALATIWRHHA